MIIKQILGIAAVVLTFVSYVPYIRDIIKGKTKPHAFTWLIWSILTLVSFAAQISDNAGPGAYMNLATLFLCGYIFFVALKYKSNIVKSDYISFVLALLTIPLWIFSKNPAYSVLLIVMIDIFAFIPTIRKSFINPSTETSETYLLNSFKHVLSLSALSRYTLVTALYSSYLVIVNLLFAIMLIIRRKQIPVKK